MHKYIVEADDFINLRVALDSLISRVEDEIRDDVNNQMHQRRRNLKQLIELERKTNYRNMRTIRE